MKLFMFFSFIYFFSCGLGTESIFEGKIVTDKNYAESLIKDAVDTLFVDGKKVILSPYLWRNFMPSTSENTDLLIAVNTFIEVDSQKINDVILPEKQFVINGEKVWVVSYTNEHNDKGFKIEKFSRKGPRWEVGSEVVILSQVKNRITQEKYFLKKENVYIGRVD